MNDTRPLEEPKRLGAGKPAPEAVTRLYHKAFEQYGTVALWSRRPSTRPTIRQALAIADALRSEGDLRARALAVEIEATRRAAL